MAPDSPAWLAPLTCDEEAPRFSPLGRALHLWWSLHEAVAQGPTSWAARRSVSPEWNDFRRFYEDAGPPPSLWHGLYLNRGQMTYGLGLCHWDLRPGYRPTRLVSVDGWPATLSEVAKETGLPRCAVQRLFPPYHDRGPRA